jgi:hypothetical protein
MVHLHTDNFPNLSSFESRGNPHSKALRVGDSEPGNLNSSPTSIKTNLNHNYTDPRSISLPPLDVALNSLRNGELKKEIGSHANRHSLFKNSPYFAKRVSFITDPENTNQ